jgi:hypothetical protein
LKLAKQLIDQIASETFDPTQYRERRCASASRLTSKRKVQGQDISQAAEPSAEPAR